MNRRNFLREGFITTLGAALIPSALLSLAGCRKTLLDTEPYGAVSSSTMWTTDNLTTLGVSGVYEVLRSGGVCGNFLYQMDMYGFCTQNRDASSFMMGTVTTSDDLFSSNWQNLYEGIHRANDAITNIPLKSPTEDSKKLRFLAECKFLRALYYFNLNRLYKGVPIYLEPITDDQAIKERSSEQEVWKVIIDDLTDCINEVNLPLKYTKGAGDFGRVTKGAAYALRGKAYLYQQKWADAATDFGKVKDAGFSLFSDYKTLFSESNEQCDEMIFTVQNLALSGYGSDTQFKCGTRSSFGSCWNTFLPTPRLVDLYENKDGSPFDWDSVLPGYNNMQPKEREVFFFRNGLSTSEISAAKSRGLDMSKYLSAGNEERLQQAYDNRDPRLDANIILPYASYVGVLGGVDHKVYSRWPYRQEAAPTNDLRTDTQSNFFYLFRKYVYEGAASIPARDQCPTDLPILRYADVLLMWAEALNEQGANGFQEAINKVNEVRSRVGMPLLQNTDSAKPTYTANQSTLRKRIQDERRREFPNEGVNVFDEMRWKTLKEEVFDNNGGIQQVWGANTADYSWKGDYLYNWAIPQTEIERNTNLKQNSGWIG